MADYLDFVLDTLRRLAVYDLRSKDRQELFCVTSGSHLVAIRCSQNAKISHFSTIGQDRGKQPGTHQKRLFDAI
jgi:hypothetical protein